MLTPILVNADDAMSYQVQVGVIRHHISDSRELVSRPPIVAIQKRYDLAMALRNAGIKRRCLAAIRLAQQANLRFEPTHDIRRAICGAIVYNDNLSLRRREILLQHTNNRFFYESFLIVGI